ncbi:voltage-gated potassium channel [Lactarius indigo]|nr:voltage-gated potassium channel [Lactarius indigo]
MPRFLLSAAFLAHLLPGKDSSARSDADPDTEKGDSDGLGAPKAGDDNAEDRDFDASDDEQEGTAFTEGEEDEPRPTQRSGVRLVPTSTISSTTLSGFTRPSLPKCLFKMKDVLFGSPTPPDETAVSTPNYRLTPIISGSLIPFSILLQIPGLTEHWYVRTDGTKIVESRKNSALLELSLILSMALAVFANLALICRFMERRVKLCTILSIVSLTIHDLLNIVTVVIFGVQHRFDDGFTYGEAYWMTICSTVVSMITNVTLIWDLVKTPNFSKSGSGITRRQRSLVIITMIFLSYVAFGALMSSLMMTLTFLNGLFFTIVTTLTIGFGDIVPVTPAQRVAVCIYAVFGIVILGAAIRLTTEAVLEGIEVGYRRRLQGYKKRRGERKREREQVRRWRAAVEKRLVGRELEVWTPDKPPSPSALYEKPKLHRRGSSFILRGSTFRTQPMRLNTEALSTEELESAAQEAGVPLEEFIGRKFRRRARSHHHHHHHRHHHHDQDQGDQRQQHQQPQAGQSTRVPLEYSWTIDPVNETEPQKNRIWGAWWERACKALRLEKSGDPVEETEPESSPSLTSVNMLKVLEREERRSLYFKLGLSWALFFTFWTIGSLIFSHTEGWTYGEAMYFCFIAFTTIGYGDLAPETALGRAIFVFWALFGVGAMTVLIAVLTDAFSSKYRHVAHNKKTFDRAVSRYRQGQDKSTRPDAFGKGEQPLSQFLHANLAKMSSSRPARTSTPQPGLTLAEADECLRARIEPLPAIVLKEVLKFREHTRFFFIASGHVDALCLPPDPRGKSGISFPQENVVPEGLKNLLDEIAQEEGFDERLKQEAWDDEHARNTLFVLSLEKGARRLVEAAELAMEMLARRDQLVTSEERDVTNGEQDGEASCLDSDKRDI